MQSWGAYWGLREPEKGRQARYATVLYTNTLQRPLLKMHLFWKLEMSTFIFCSCCWQRGSLWREWISPWTWSISAHTRPSPWRTWWCPPTPHWWAGWGSRAPAPNSAQSTSSPGTSSQRATLFQLWLHWTRNCWNDPCDFFLNFMKTVTIWSTAWDAHNVYYHFICHCWYFLVTWKILELLLIYKCTYWIQGDLHFSPKSCFLAFLPALLVCLHLSSAIYSDDCDTFHELAKWRVLSYADQSNNGTTHFHIAVVSTTL